MTLPLEKQVCSLESAKILKELGVKQESLFYWVHFKSYAQKGGTFAPQWALRNHKGGEYDSFETISAYTVAELGGLLPECVGDICAEHSDFSIYPDYGFWFCAYRPCGKSKTISYEVNADTMAEALAKMLIYLNEQGLMK